MDIGSRIYTGLTDFKKLGNCRNVILINGSLYKKWVSMVCGGTGPTMISEILLVAGIGVLSLALRNFAHPVMFRLGTLGFVATSFLAGWMLGGSVLLGIVFASTWFLLPWVEILTRIRRLRLPLHRSLEKCAPPPYSQFPNFGELTDQMEESGFEYVEDVDWNDDQSRHFYRLFYHPQIKATGKICLIEEGQFSFY